MLDNQNPMDEQLRKKFESFEMTPPDTVWDGVKSSLKSAGGMASWVYFVPAVLSLAFFTIYACFGDLPLNSNAFPSANFESSLDADAKINQVNKGEDRNSKTLNDQQRNDSDVIADLDSNFELKDAASTSPARMNKNPLQKKNVGERKLPMNAWNATQSQRKLKASISGNESSEESSSFGTVLNTSTSSVVPYLNDGEENHSFVSSLVLPKKSLGAYYYVNSANPTKFPFNPIKQQKYPSHRFDRFSIEGGVGISTFRINPIEKNNPDLTSIAKQWNSGEFGIGAQFGVNYAFRGNYAVSVGIEVISQRNKLIGKIEGVQTNEWIDTVGFDIDTIFQDTFTWYLDTVWILNTTETQSSYVLEANSVNRSTMLIIPFSFSMRKALGVRSALEFNLGGSLGIYQVGSGQVILNSSGQVVSLESAYRKKGQLMANASVKYLYQMTLKQALYIEPRIGVGVNNFYQSSFNYQSRISQLGIRIGYRMYL